MMKLSNFNGSFKKFFDMKKLFNESKKKGTLL